MEARHRHSLAFVEAMRILPLGSRIQVQLQAALLGGIFLEPAQQFCPISSGPMFGVGDKIVNVQVTPPRKIFTNPESRNRNKHIGLLHKGQMVAGLFLAPNPGNELVLCKVGPKLPHYGITGGNFLVGCGNANIHVCFDVASVVQGGRRAASGARRLAAMLELHMNFP